MKFNCNKISYENTHGGLANVVDDTQPAVTGSSSGGASGDNVAEEEAAIDISLHVISNLSTYLYVYQCPPSCVCENLLLPITFSIAP